MAWRFKASKFKNTSPKLPKKEESIYDLPIGSLSCVNNGIEANNSLIAFHIEGEGGKLGVLRIDTKGRRLRQDLSIICAHAEQVTDFQFLPFDKDILVTCSRDDKVKLWHVPSDDPNCNHLSLSSAYGEIDLGGAHTDCLACHSTAAGILAVGTGNTVTICDVVNEKIAIELGGLTDRVMGVGWSGDGKLLSTVDRTKIISIFDCRAGAQPIMTAPTHGGLGREARTIFMGDTGRVVSSGFTSKRTQEVLVYDLKDFSKPLVQQEFMPSTSVLMPFYDADTQLLFLAGKGSNKFFLTELNVRDLSLYIVAEQSTPEQTLGGTLLRKTSMDVMSGEVQRFLQLTRNAVVPITCVVPRRSYRDFHEDLFPDTVGNIAGCSSTQWLTGNNSLPPKFSMHPSKKNLIDSTKTAATNGTTNGVTKVERPTPVIDADFRPKSQSKEDQPFESTPLAAAVGVAAMDDRSFYQTPTSEDIGATFYFTPDGKGDNISSSVADSKPLGVPESESAAPAEIPPPLGKIVGVSRASAEEVRDDVADLRAPPRRRRSPLDTGATETPSPVVVKMRTNKADAVTNGTTVRHSLVQTRERPKTCVVGVRQSKFRHILTVPGKKDTLIWNLRKVNTRVPIESNGFCVSAKWAAVPLMGPGGVVSIFELSKGVKVGEGVIPGLENKANVTDMVWCPHNQNRLAVACDNGVVNIWDVPNDGIVDFSLLPTITFQASSDKVVSLRWHPTAKDVLLVASVDCAVRVVDLSATDESSRTRISLSGHEQSVLSMAWSADGSRVATVSKDAIMRVYEPRTGGEPIEQKKVLDKVTGARVLFGCEDQLLILVNFSRRSDRQISLYDAVTLEHRHTLPVDTSPQILLPHYDYDTSILTLTGKGDRSLHMYEVCPEEPWLMALAGYTMPTGHQSLSVQQKSVCDVRQVEVQRAYRLTDKTVEQLSFRVPRKQMDVFYGELYPDALVTWRATMTADEWFGGAMTPPDFRSMRPDDLHATSDFKASSSNSTNGQPPAAKKHAPGPVDKTPSPPQNPKELVGSIQDRLIAMSANLDEGLEQDKMEGVDKAEWD